MTERRVNKKRRVIPTIIFIIALAVFAYSAYRIYLIMASTNESKKVTQTLAERVVVEIPEVEEEEKEVVPVIDWDAALKENEDIVAWLYQKDTVINYPICQGKDNEAYLHTLIDGTTNKHGTLFLDYRCDPAFTDVNSVIYGHHMKDGTMFGSIVGYQDQTYYDEHPTMYLLTPEKDYRIEFIGGYVAKDDAPIYMVPATEDDRAEILQKAEKDATFKHNVQISEDAPLVTLSTCSYEFENARYVLIGQLIELEDQE